ncbi:MAG: hypothetical protein HY652_02275 [Acidobacteria bacterium]|nr:hypothetical protein [Acidobacteriota bacterium]
MKIASLMGWRRALGIVCLSIVSVAAIVCGHLLREIENANEILSEKDYQRAEQRYLKALGSFRKFNGLRIALPGQFERAFFNYVKAVYSQRRYSDVVEILQNEAAQFPELAGTGAYHLWMGNALFRVAVLQEGEGLELESLQTVVGEYELAVEADRDSWDAKHNYEFIRKLVAQSTSKDPREKEDLQLLVGEIRHSSEEAGDKLPEKLH